MGCFGPDAPKARKYANEMRDTLQAQIDLAPQWYGVEAAFQPRYAQLANRVQGISLLGRDNIPGGTMGLYREVMPQYTDLMSAANSASRAADAADLQQYGPQMVAAMMQADPEAYRLMQQLTTQAGDELALGSELDPSQLRLVQQSVRAGQANRGLGYGAADQYAETLGVSSFGQALKEGRQSQAGRVLALRRALSGDASNLVLGRNNAAGSQAQNAFSQAAGISAGAGPGLFNPESAYAGNLYAGNQGYDWQYKQASPSTWGKITQVSDTMGSFIGKVAGGMMCWVAREVYGLEDARWLVFRNWMLEEAPAWLRGAYRHWGPAVARWLRGKRRAKAAVRWLMDRAVNHRMKEAR
jgi:hypothetical protein